MKTATLLSSDNKYIKTPCKVEVDILEFGVSGQILQCNVREINSKVFVRAKNALFDKAI